MKINITRRHLEVFITESSNRSQQARKEYTLYNEILVLVKDPLSPEIDLEYCLEEIKRVIPRHLMYGLDSIIIGDFPEFKERQINAFYRDGAIYVSNIQDDDDDLIDDVVHEVAHLVEKTFGSILYEDQKIMREFLGKRQRLYYLLRADGYDVSAEDFLQTEYSREFDELLFKKIGYPLLTQLTIGLFITPYGITSLPEYFAESFEYFLLKDAEYVRKISPEVYRKILEIKELTDE
tara:strand:+ start:1445 stop:2152 length:708 start_codon:yes stop_codon:yes gene_type:complete